MTGQKEYSAELTGEPFLYFEIKQVARLKLAGLSQQEIMKKVKEENLFQYATDKSTGKILTAVWERVSVLDATLLNILVNGPSESSKIVALYAVSKVNRLFSEFLHEVYKEQMISGEMVITSRDFSVFFSHKGEQSPRVAGWQDYTRKKLSQVYARILKEAGLLNNRVETYLKKTNSVKLPESIQDIVASKQREQKDRKERIKNLLSSAIAEADIYINAEKVDLKTGLPKERIDQAFAVLVESIYIKLNYLKKFVSSNSDIWDILIEDDRQIVRLCGEKP